MQQVELQKDIPAGIWLSYYRYTSSGRNDVFEDRHYVRLFHQDRHIIIESVPKLNKSYVLVHLSFSDDIATGTWQEETDPDGYYAGAIYMGAIQLVVDKDHKHMEGKWVGFGKDMEVNTGPWEFTYIGKTVPNSKFATYASKQI